MGVQTMKQLVILTLLINIALGANIRKPEPESSFVEEQSDYLFSKAKFDEYEIYVQNQAIETPKLDGKILKSSDYGPVKFTNVDQVKLAKLDGHEILQYDVDSSEECDN